MTLENRLLQKLVEQPGSQRRHEFQASDPESGWNLYLTAERRDDLSCLVWELTLRRHAAEGDVQAWADAIAGRTNGLEKLRVHEVDAALRQALLRGAPALRNGQNFYYEVHLSGTGAITLRRFQSPAQTGMRRRQVAFAITNEALAKLAGDLTGA